MMKRSVAIIASSVFLLACQPQAAAIDATMPAVSSTEVNGDWLLYKTLDGDNAWSVPPDSQFSLMLKDDKASGLVACNQWRSQAQVLEGQLILGPASTTRMRCSSSDAHVDVFSIRYLQQLNQGMKIIQYPVDVVEKVLVLESSDKQQWFFKAR